MDTLQSQTRIKFPLSSQKILKKTLIGSFGAIFLSLLIFFICFSLTQNDNRLIVSIFISMIVLCIHILSIWIYQYYYFQQYYYDLTENFVVIRKGVLSSSEITIPYQRIQDVYVDQDILDRVFGLYDVHLTSATFSSGLEAHIDGVMRQGAEGIKSLLLNKLQHVRISNLQNKPYAGNTPNAGQSVI